MQKEKSDAVIYPNIKQGVFHARPNRFLAQVEVDGVMETVHVKNTGRCKELLIPNAQVFVQEFDTQKRKTKFDLIAVKKGSRLIHMDSQAPNKIFAEYVASGAFLQGITLVKPEQTYQSSRFDFYLEVGARKVFVEVKGVTLEENNICRFPDAPTLRGVKHLEELLHATRNGYEAWVVFVLQMDNVQFFTPNDTMHLAFGDALRKAAQGGVQVLALECKVSPNSIEATKAVPCRL